MIDTYISVTVITIIVLFHFYLWYEFCYKISSFKSLWFVFGSLVSVFSLLVVCFTMISNSYESPWQPFDFLIPYGLGWMNIFIISTILLLIGDRILKVFYKFKVKSEKMLTRKNFYSKVKIVIVFGIVFLGTVINMDNNKKHSDSINPSSSITGALPFKGRWMVGSTPAKQIPSHGTDMFGVGYAIDFMAVDEKNRTSPDWNWKSLFGTESPERFYSFGKPVYSPVSGKVVSVHNKEEDHEVRRSLLTLVPYAVKQGERIRKGAEAIAGNYIVISVEDTDMYIAIVHLQLNSLRVEVGENISKGKHIANCGNSGNSTQPHIHIQAMSSSDFYNTRGIPLYFEDFYLNLENY